MYMGLNLTDEKVGEHSASTDHEVVLQMMTRRLGKPLLFNINMRSNKSP